MTVKKKGSCFFSLCNGNTENHRYYLARTQGFLLRTSEQQKEAFADNHIPVEVTVDIDNGGY